MTVDPDKLGESLAYMLELREAEADGAREVVAFGPYTALTLIGGLQLATRHPSMPASVRAELLDIIEQFKPWFVGTLGEHIIDMGNDPEQDR